MKNSSQTKHCISKIRGKNSRKQKKMEHYRNAFPASTVHSANTIHPAATVHLLFDASDFCYNFLFLSILSLIIPSDLGFFVISPCSEHI